jgi:broad specificity phosphatase PhoE
MLDIILTRHATAADGSIILGSEIDLPLTPFGKREAELLGRRLKGIRLDRIVSSPMKRAVETAEAIAAGRPVEADARLREMDYGHWEGLTHTEVDARDPELRARWEHDPASTHAPGGECGDDVATRVRSFLVSLIGDELGAPPPAEVEVSQRRSPDAGGSRPPVSETEAEAHGDRRVAVIAHGTVNRILLCVALEVPIRDFRRRFIQDRANLTVIRYEPGDGPDGGQLVLLNDVSHLRHNGQAPWGA